MTSAQQKSSCVLQFSKTESVIFVQRLMIKQHVSDKVNSHNVRIWGLENSQETIERERDFPRVDVCCAVFLRELLWAFFEKNTISGRTNLELLQQWLFSKSIKILKISSLIKMEHHRIDIVMCEVF